MKKAILIYIPVLHKGYLDFLAREGVGAPIFILDDSFARKIAKEGEREISGVTRDPRCLSASDVKLALQGVLPKKIIEILYESEVDRLREFDEIILPDEDILTRFFEKYFFGTDDANKFKSINTFLRWDMPRSLSKVPPKTSGIITSSDLLDKQIMDFAESLRERSSDWWRQIGGVLIGLDGRKLWVFNKHMPHEFAPYFAGDPRANFNAGEYVELSTSGHCEATLISIAARKGIITEGASLYVDTFPCPPCAYAVANAGIKKLYFKNGYSLVGSAETLLEYGVGIIQVVD